MADRADNQPSKITTPRTARRPGGSLSNNGRRVTNSRDRAHGNRRPSPYSYSRSHNPRRHKDEGGDLRLRLESRRSNKSPQGDIQNAMADETAHQQEQLSYSSNESHQQQLVALKITVADGKHRRRSNSERRKSLSRDDLRHKLADKYPRRSRLEGQRRMGSSPQVDLRHILTYNRSRRALLKRSRRKGSSPEIDLRHILADNRPRDTRLGQSQREDLSLQVDKRNRTTRTTDKTSNRK